MNITRNNYEAFFILYMDNELDQESRLAVEVFAQAHPDLGEELNLLLQTRFVPENHIQFEGKEALLQSTSLNSIHENNYLNWFLLHTDRELDNQQESELLDWLVKNPGYKDELNQLLRTRIESDTAVIFPNKESLYRREAPRRAITLTWRRIAVAASLLIAIATTALLLNNAGKNGDNPESGSIAVVTTDSNNTQKKAATENQITKTENPDAITGQEAFADDPDAAVNNIVADGTKKESENKKILTGKDRNASIEAVPEYTNVKRGNQLPERSHNPNTKEIGVENNNMAITENTDWVKLEAPENTPLTNSKQIKALPLVTPDNRQPSDFVYAGNQIMRDEGADMDEPGKKNKLRGFFRKVTRTFEKATNLKATDEDDRLLIGGLAIQL